VPYVRGTVRLADLRPHPQNYRSHPRDQIEHLKASIAEFGVYRAILTARDSTIIAGHGVVQAALELSPDIVAEEVRYDLDPQDPLALKLLAVDNEVGRFAEVDDRALTEILRRINEEAPSALLGTGYDDQMLNGLVMLTRTAAELRAFDASGEWVGMPAYDAEENPWQLRISFDTADQRMEFLEHFGIKDQMTYTNSIRKVISARWPMRDGVRNDAGLRWEEVDAAQQAEQ